MMITLFFLLFLGFGSSLAAYPNCAAGVTCPPGGIWTEWAVTGRKTCPSDCGSCARLFYTRSCISRSAGCACTGDSSKYVLCNTKSCLYPSQRSCCAPYVPMMIAGTLQCGPIPADTSSGTCCPIGGLWSSWSGYARPSAGAPWRRTRNCVTAEVGCPCTGEGVQTTTSCPCPDMKTASEVNTLCRPQFSSGQLVYGVNRGSLDATECIYTASIKSNNDDDDFPCLAYNGYGAVAKVAVHDVSSSTLSCPQDWVFNCDAVTVSSPPQNITFTCDPSISQWRYDSLAVPVDGYIQLQLGYKG